MYWTMLRRELSGRKKHTAIVAAALAVAVALVMVVSALTTGVQQAQEESLQSVYGIGTDLTVTAEPAMPGTGDEGQMPGGGGPRFEFANGEGSTVDGVTSFAQSQLTTQMGTTSFAASTLDTVSELPGVFAATGTLSLSNMSFTGDMPDMSRLESGSQTEGGMPGGPGGPDGQGGSSFGVDSFTVLGVTPDAQVGPLTATTLAEGRMLTADDQDTAALTAVLDSSYATTQELTVGDTLQIAAGEVEVVGILESTGSDASAAADVFLPLSTAQQLADLEDQVTTVSVSATSVNDIGSLQYELETALPDFQVNSQEELAAQLSGSLATTTALITNLGTWLSVAVLAVAVLLAILLTLSGVTRRTREFGTLKAIGWSNRRVMGQIAGESAVQALIGAVAGTVLGLVSLLIVNAWGPTIGGGSSNATSPNGAPEMPGGGFGGPGGLNETASAAAEITLTAPLNLWIIATAIGLSLAGGLLAALFGAWRVSRLSPAEALRSAA